MGVYRCNKNYFFVNFQVMELFWRKLPMKAMKKHVSMPSLLERSRKQFSKVPDEVNSRSRISLVDCLMSGLAIFSLKFPSLLQFEEAWDDNIIRHNLQTLFGITRAPCDTYLR